MNLLCRLGLHRVRWTPPVPQHHDWIRLRTCSRCGLPLPRTTVGRTR